MTVTTSETETTEKAGAVLNNRNRTRMAEIFSGMKKLLGMANEIMAEAGVEVPDDEAEPDEETAPDETEDEADEETPAKSYGLYRQPEVNYVTVSPKTGKQQCANCRWFKATEYYEGQAVGASCHIVESWPLDILPTGWCDQWQQVPEPTENPMPVYIVENVEMGYVTPKPLPTLQRALQTITGKAKPGVTFTRAADGLRLAVIFTSNGYEDREGEYLATDALKEYVTTCYTKDGAWQGDNKLLFWHHHGLDIGDLVFADIRAETFLVEIAKERATPLAGLVWDYWEANPAALDWGASHGFKAVERTVDTFKKIRKYETSILPRKAAANLLTYSGVVPMASERDKMIDQIFKLEGAAKILDEKGPLALTEELRKRGIVHRSATVETTVNVAEADAANALISDLIEGMAAIVKEFDNVKSTADSATKSAGEVATLKQTVEAQQAIIAELQKAYNLRPKQASTAPETVATEEERKQVEENLPIEYDDFWSSAGMKVARSGGTPNGSE